MRNLALLLAASLTLGGCARDSLRIAPDHPQVLSGEWTATLRESRQLQGLASGPQGLYLAVRSFSFPGPTPLVVVERRSPGTGEVLAREEIPGSGVGAWTPSALALRGDELVLLTADDTGRRLTLHTLDPLTLRPLRAPVTLPDDSGFRDLVADGEVLRVLQGSRELWLSTRTLEPLPPLAPDRARISPDGGWWWRVGPPGQGGAGEVGRSGQEQGFRVPGNCNSDRALLGLPTAEGGGERLVTLSCGRLQVFAQDGTLLQEHPLSPGRTVSIEPQLLALPGGQVGHTFSGGNDRFSGRFDPESGTVTVTTTPEPGLPVTWLTPWGLLSAEGGTSWNGDALQFAVEELPLRLVTRSTYVDARRHEVSGDLFLRGERFAVAGTLVFHGNRSGDGFVPQGSLPPGGHMHASFEFSGGRLSLSNYVSSVDGSRRHPHYHASLLHEGKTFTGSLVR